MRRVHFAIPGDLDTPTGGYSYGRQLIAGLQTIGWNVRHVALPTDFPFPDATARTDSAAEFASLPSGELVLVDGLAGGALPEVMADHADRLRLVALVHHPLGDERGLTAALSRALHRSERAALGHVRRIVCTSSATAERLQTGFGVDRAHIVIARPGTVRAPRASGTGTPPHILSIGSLIPRKRHDVLIEALGLLRHRAWTSRIVGSHDLDLACARQLARQVTAAGLDQRVVLAGAVVDTRVELARADVFALASEYEGYGMAFAEALSQGVPIVACRTGAIADLVPEAAGELVPPGKPDAFATALAGLLDDVGRRRECADAAWTAGAALPTWTDTATIVAAALEGAAQ